MSRLKALALLLAVAPLSAVPPQQEPLIQPNNLTYLGAFRLPGGVLPGAVHGFDYSLSGFAYNPIHNSLYVNNHAYEQKTAEVSIPALSTNMGSLATAALLQNPVDVTEGNMQNVLSKGGTYTKTVYIGGLFVYNNLLLGDVYIYYDGGFEGAMSHFTHSLTLSQSGTFQGMYPLGTENPGLHAGGMAAIPPQWQPASLFGGPMLTGQCCLANIGRSSQGPAAFVFDPAQLNIISTAPATALLYYDAAHPTLGDWNNKTVAGNDYNMGTNGSGMVFPVGTRSVLFFGRKGLGVPCYGTGTSDPSLAGQPDGQGNLYCFDPADAGKGGHAYPYASWIWAYDANDLLAVKNGQKQPWAVVPYQSWEIQFPFVVRQHDIQGVAYDPATQRIYVSQYGAAAGLPGGDPNDVSPIIHAFQVNNSAPPPPSPCDVNKDTLTNIADVQLEANMAIGTSSCTSDINQDGQCSVIDVQRVVVAALGGACVSP